jgi:hypothetical protein
MADKLYKISHINDVRKAASKFIHSMDLLHPKGVGMSDTDMVKYVQAQSVSSFIGIQNPSQSQIAFNSFKSTLQSHSNPSIASKP